MNFYSDPLHPDPNQIADLIIAEREPTQPLFAQQTIAFLDLPSEIRNKIYHLIGPSFITKSYRTGLDAAWLDAAFLEPDSFAPFTDRPEGQYWRKVSRHPQSSLAATCRQVHQEIGQARCESSIKAFEVWNRAGFFVRYPFNANLFSSSTDRPGSAHNLLELSVHFMGGYVDLTPMLDKMTGLKSLTINVRPEDNYQVYYGEELQRHRPADQRYMGTRWGGIDDIALQLWLDGKDPHTRGVDVSIIPDHLQDEDHAWVQPRVDPPLEFYKSYHDLFNCALRGCAHLWPNWEWRLSAVLEEEEVAQLAKLTDAVMTGKYGFRLFIRHVLHVRCISKCTRLVSSLPPLFNPPPKQRSVRTDIPHRL